MSGTEYVDILVAIWYTENQALIVIQTLPCGQPFEICLALIDQDEIMER